MGYWLTTHWPPRVDQPADRPHGGVWVQDGKRHVIDPMAPDDLVFIYQSQSGQTEIRTYLDGSTKKIPCRHGREGVVALVRVTERAYQPEDSQPATYTNGRQVWWRYYAPTESVNSAGFIPRRQAAVLLGYAQSYVFRGFGEEHSGLKQISADTFERLRAAFIAFAESDEQQRITRASQADFGPGGEGPEHLALKHRIAADPAGTLGEAGLRLWNVEWGLPTSDCIDVVLKDSYDRFVSVEVEVDCGATEIVGPLQCMKYRSMLSYFFDRPFEEVRTILAAHSIHPGVRQRCGLHGIQSIVVPRG
jgi:hypothetical protein